MFPYTDLQTLNLDWLLNKMKLTAEQLEALQDLLSESTVRDILEDLLRQMAESGELDDLVMDALFAQKFIQTEDEYEEYADAMADAVISYLANMAIGTCDSIVGTPIQTQPFVAIYNDVDSVLAPALLSYDCLVDKTTKFGVYSTNSWQPQNNGFYDQYAIGPNVYPIFYQNCTGFVGMLTRNRKYADSPWYKLFTWPGPDPIDPADLAACAVEKGDTDTAPFTFDCMNQRYSWRMCENMKASGCTPFLVATKDAGNWTVDDVAISRLRDGDILFSGNPNVHPTRYHGISHCMMYFKTLERLNAAAGDYGVAVQPYHGNVTSDLGYIVHCSGLGAGNPNNTFRIETLEHYYTTEVFSNGAVIYGCNVSANALNSSKLFFGVSGDWVLTSCIVNSAYRHYGLEDGQIPYGTVRALASGTQNGVFSYGQYRYAQPSPLPLDDPTPIPGDDDANPDGDFDFDKYITPKKAGIYTMTALNVHLLNGPTAGNTSDAGVSIPQPTTQYFILEVQDCTLAAGYVVQTVTTLYHDNPHKYERVLNYGTGRASVWKVVY
jgi:hypothetical protein